MDPNMQKALSNPESWKKGAVMLLFFLMLAVVTPLLIMISIVGWVFLMVRGQEPDNVRGFGCSLAAWYAQTARYLTGDAERRPFPFEDLDCPSDEPLSASAQGKDQSGPARPPRKGPNAASQAEPAAAGRRGERQSESTAANLGQKPAIETADNKAGSRKAGKKKAGGKKVVEKKAARKKVGSKKAGARKVSKKKTVSKEAVSKKTPVSPASGNDQES